MWKKKTQKVWLFGLSWVKALDQFLQTQVCPPPFARPQQTPGSRVNIYKTPKSSSSSPRRIRPAPPPPPDRQRIVRCTMTLLQNQIRLLGDPLTQSPGHMHRPQAKALLPLKLYDTTQKKPLTEKEFNTGWKLVTDGALHLMLNGQLGSTFEILNMSFEVNWGHVKCNNREKANKIRQQSLCQDEGVVPMGKCNQLGDSDSMGHGPNRPILHHQDVAVAKHTAWKRLAQTKTEDCWSSCHHHF